MSSFPGRSAELLSWLEVSSFPQVVNRAHATCYKLRLDMRRVAVVIFFLTQISFARISYTLPLCGWVSVGAQVHLVVWSLWIFNASDVVLRIIGGWGYWARELWKHCSITAFNLLCNILGWCNIHRHTYLCSLLVSLNFFILGVQLFQSVSTAALLDSWLSLSHSKKLTFPNWSRGGHAERKLAEGLTSSNWRVKYEWG